MIYKKEATNEITTTLCISQLAQKRALLSSYVSIRQILFVKGMVSVRYSFVVHNLGRGLPKPTMQLWAQ